MWHIELQSGKEAILRIRHRREILRTMDVDGRIVEVPVDVPNDATECPVGLRLFRINKTVNGCTTIATLFDANNGGRLATGDYHVPARDRFGFHVQFNKQYSRSMALSNMFQDDSVMAHVSELPRNLTDTDRAKIVKLVCPKFFKPRPNMKEMIKFLRELRREELLNMRGNQMSAQLKKLNRLLGMRDQADSAYVTA